MAKRLATCASVVVLAVAAGAGGASAASKPDRFASVPDLTNRVRCEVASFQNEITKSGYTVTKIDGKVDYKISSKNVSTSSGGVSIPFISILTGEGSLKRVATTSQTTTLSYKIGLLKKGVPVPAICADRSVRLFKANGSPAGKVPIKPLFSPQDILGRAIPSMGIPSSIKQEASFNVGYEGKAGLKLEALVFTIEHTPVDRTNSTEGSYSVEFDLDYKKSPRTGNWSYTSATTGVRPSSETVPADGIPVTADLTCSGPACSPALVRAASIP